MSKSSSKQVKRKDTPHSGAIVDVTRKVKDWERLLLFVRAGGRCEFDGCNKYLLEHHVTLLEGNFAQMAHIVAFSEDGPRGLSGRPLDINSVDNLMALCPECHKLIDDDPTKFTKQTLVGYKEQHEHRIKHVTGLGPDQKTSIVTLKTKIGQQTVAFPFDQILEAITPRYPYSKEGLTIDLTPLSTASDGFLTAACDTIKDQLRVFFSPGGEYNKSGHISLFALAPIPILAFLGSQLSNKVPVDIYQRHRDKENWSWKVTDVPVHYTFKKLRTGGKLHSVALVLSLSGAIDMSALPSSVNEEFSVYEMTIENLTPSPTFLNARGDLEQFRVAYQFALGNITKDHSGLTSIHLFPAVPAPIAVLCGRELLPKVHPELRIYDNDKQKGGFTYQLSINQL